MKQLLNSKTGRIAEIIVVFLMAFIIIKVFSKPDDGDLIFNQLVIWIANIVMLVIIWLGLKARGASCKALGLTFGRISVKEAFFVFLKSLLVFVFALAGFIVGSMVMTAVSGVPDNPDMSSYEFLKDNLPMLLVTLVGVYIASSFGEEVVYRGFLINGFSRLFSNNKVGTWMAVICSAVIFGLAHYSWGTVGVVQTTFMGLALGISYILLNKRLWILILAHAYMDTILMVQLYMASN